MTRHAPLRTTDVHPEPDSARTEIVSLASQLRMGASRVSEGATDSLATAGYARFELTGELGRGGMGVVHRALDRAIQREVALKVLLDGAGSVETVARFVREARVTGQLEHAGIPPVYDLGLTPTGAPYFAMKLVRGRSLRAHLEDLRTAAPRERRQRLKAFTLEQRLDVLLKVGEALTYAHARGVIHRDLKPDNVMVGEFGEVQVMDWGLAKLLDATEEEPIDARPVSDDAGPTALLTRDGAVAGTPAYMAPEQARGEVRTLDVRADVFAVGALLYELLTLSPPYRGASSLEVVVIAGEGAWLPIPERLAADGFPLPAAPPELVAIAHHALAVDRDRRYASVAAMLADLRAYRAHVPVSVHRDRLVGGSVKWVRRHPRAALALASLLAVSVLAALLWAARGRAESESLRAALADARADEARRGRSRAEQLATLTVSDETRIALDELEQRWAEARARGESDQQFFEALGAARLAMYQVAYDGLVAVHEARNVRPDAVVYYNRGLLREASGNFAGALVDLDMAVQLDPRRPEAYVNRAIARLALGDPAAAIADLDRALTLDPASIAAYTNRANARQAQGDVAGALADLDRVLAIDPRRVLCYITRGNVRASQGDSAGAIADYDRALALAPRHEEALYNRALARQATGDLDGALADLDQALSIAPRYADAFHNRAIVRKERGDLAGALADLEQVLALRPPNASVLVDRGLVRLLAGDTDGALADYDQAFAHEPRSTRVLVHRGSAHEAKGDVERALADYDHALVLDSRCVLAYLSRGSLRLSRGDGAGAMEDLERAVELDPRSAHAHNRRGQARHVAGDHAGALADFDRAVALDPRLVAALNNRGNARQASGDLTGALADYDQVLTLDATHWRAAANRGGVLAARGQRAEALSSFVHAHRVCRDPAARSQLEATIRKLGGEPGR